MIGDPIGLASASDLAAMLDRRAIGSVELLDHFLERIERYNPAYNLVVTFDRERAAREAAQADARRMAGDVRGPLDGLPITVKECWETVGMPTSCGFEALRDHMAAEDADAVASLRSSGAIIFGKTNLPQGASDWQSFNPNYGLSGNPWDPDRSPGGSSGGSAGSVACGFTSFELGSDIGGSIRIPAHFCGVFGHKSSYGLVPLRGHIPPMPGELYAPEMGVAGPLARSAEDLALVLSVIADADRLPALRPARHGQSGGRLEDFRVAVWMGDGSYRLDDAYGAMLEDYIDDLGRAGAGITRVALPVDPAESLEIYEHTLFAMVGVWTPGSSEIYAAMAEEDETGVAARLARYTASDLAQWFALQERRAGLMRAWARFFSEYDVLLTPQAPVLAFKHMAEGDGVHWEQIARRITVNGQPEPYIDFSWQALALVANLPATCMPTGRPVNGLPGGLQVIGPYMEDLTTIGFAGAAAQAAGGYIPPPAVAG